MPRYWTPRNPDRRTIGPLITGWHTALTGHPAMPHQKFIHDIAGELDVDGHLYYDTVVLVEPRQCGKTSTVEAKNTCKAHLRADALGVYAAQNRGAARVKIIDDYEERRLARCALTAGRYKVIKSNGREGITWNNGSKLVIVSNTADAGHGLAAVDDVTIDEAFSHPDLTVVTALAPTQLTAKGSQLWVTSTVGDGTDGLLQHYQDLGAMSLHDPDTRVCYLEWSAPDDADYRDPAVWAATIPALGYSIDERGVRALSHDRAVFERTMLCRRPTSAGAVAIPDEIWTRQLAGPEQTGDALEDLTGPFVVTFQVHHERTSAAIAVAGETLDGNRGVVVDRQPGVTWLVDELVKLKASRKPLHIYADRKAGAGATIDRLAHRGVFVDELETAEYVNVWGAFYDWLDAGEAFHAGQADLDRALAGAALRNLGESKCLSAIRSTTDVTPLAAASMAVWAHVKHRPRSPRRKPGT